MSIINSYYLLFSPGRQMYYYTWVIQYMSLLVANIGFILLAAKSLKVYMTNYT